MAKGKTFYHPDIMPSDKLKIILGIKEPTLEIKSYEEYWIALFAKIYELIDKAIKEGENIPDLVESYLGEKIYPDDEQEMTYQLMQTPQMIAVLMRVQHEWKMMDIEKSITPMNIIRTKNSPQSGKHESLEEGYQRTEELLEETTLRYFLEHLSMAYEDL